MKAENGVIQNSIDTIIFEANKYDQLKKEYNLAKYTMMFNYGPIGVTVKGLLDSEDIELTEMVKIVFNYYNAKLKEKHNNEIL